MQGEAGTRSTPADGTWASCLRGGGGRYSIDAWIPATRTAVEVRRGAFRFTRPLPKPEYTAVEVRGGGGGDDSQAKR